MPFLVVDIETLRQDPEPFMLPAVEDLDPPANYKKPETIAQWREERAAALPAELREKSSLEPLLGGTVFAVGLARDSAPPACLLAPSGDEEGEVAVLTRLQSGLALYPKHTLVTWNGARFDLPFLAKRALRHGLYSLAHRCYLEKPWNSRHHIDLFQAWQGSDRQALGRLRHVAGLLGIESDDKVSGKQISDLFEAGDIEAVRHHVLEDVRVTREVFLRFVAAGWVDGEESAEELPVRAPRPSREQLEVEARALQVSIAAQDLRRCAEAAGIPWVEGVDDGESGPAIVKGTTGDQLRRYLDGLRGVMASGMAG